MSRSNILVDEDTYGSTEIINLSLAAILPFSVELDCLFLTTGHMDRGGWHDYACRSQLHEVSWDEFWLASGIGSDGRRGKVRGMAERATRIVVDKDDTAYFGKSNHPKHDNLFEQFISALARIPNDDLSPEWTPSNVELTKAPDTLPLNIYIKHPTLLLYDVFQERNAFNLIPKDLLKDAQAMAMISQHSHPNIIYYHGCRVDCGCITSIIFDRLPNTLTNYLKNRIGFVYKEPFMQALESAIRHLHSLGRALNDLNPGNVLVDKVGMPILIDFGSAREIGAKLGTSRGTSRGTKGWIDRETKDYHASDYQRDLFALEKIRTWLDTPIFDD
ncbi:hypothetical protein N0V90_006521 [Kalmusia sp. IMI 367209]|nr:hypothetical protein N0V90_006521 [Kalmusia sp. IMI 367209]